MKRKMLTLVSSILFLLVGCLKNKQKISHPELDKSAIVIGDFIPSWKDYKDGDFKESVVQNARAVALIRVVAKREETKFCTGFLITNSVLMTSSECVSSSMESIDL